MKEENKKITNLRAFAILIVVIVMAHKSNDAAFDMTFDMAKRLLRAEFSFVRYSPDFDEIEIDLVILLVLQLLMDQLNYGNERQVKGGEFFHKLVPCILSHEFC